MVDHFRYIFRKRDTFYFSVRVPKPLQKHYVKHRIQICLHTSDESHALKEAQQLFHEVSKQWRELRLKNSTSEFDKYLVTHQTQPTLNEALEVYLKTKGHNRAENFFIATRRNISYLVKAIGDKSLEQFTTADASKFRIWLMDEQGLSATSTRRVMSSVKSVFNLSIGELGLAISNPFSSVYIPPKEVTGRSAMPSELLIKLQEKCLKINDEKRLIIALLSDSGMRLSEALGLHKNDIDLDSSTPSITIKEHSWRSLKTQSSNRKIPLVGYSYLAVQKALILSTSDYLFPSYCNSTTTKSNSASAALNTWLKRNLSKDYVIHSLRHSFRDRLRAIQCPSELINELGGWSKSSVGESYGDGYPLSVKHEWMQKICSS